MIETITVVAIREGICDGHGGFSHELGFIEETEEWLCEECCDELYEEIIDDIIESDRASL